MMVNNLITLKIASFQGIAFPKHIYKKCRKKFNLCLYFLCNITLSVSEALEIQKYWVGTICEATNSAKYSSETYYMIRNLHILSFKNSKRSGWSGLITKLFWRIFYTLQVTFLLHDSKNFWSWENSNAKSCQTYWVLLNKRVPDFF